MDSYTFGSDEFMMAILEKQEKELPGGGYPIELNATDFRVFVTILQGLANYGVANHKTVPSIPGYGDEEFEPIEEWAASWLSGIAETLGVEGI
jgi:hypothetical protein